MFGLTLFTLGVITFLVPLIASLLSDTVCVWMLKIPQFLASYFLAALTAMLIGGIIMIVHGLYYFICLIF